MRHRDRTLSGVLALTFSLAAGALNAQAPRVTPPPDRVIKYVKRGAPVRRVSAGVRGHGEVALDRQGVVLLAPHDHVAWTSSAQPVLFWRFAGRSEGVARALLIVSRGRAADTLALPRPEPGLQQIALRGTALRFARGADYRWSVVVLPVDADLPVVSDEAWLRVVAETAPSPGVNDPLSQVQAAAALGLWYDAFAGLTAACMLDPDDLRMGTMWTEFLTGTVRGLTPPSLQPARPLR